MNQGNKPPLSEDQKFQEMEKLLDLQHIQINKVVEDTLRTAQLEWFLNLTYSERERLMQEYTEEDSDHTYVRF